MAFFVIQRDTTLGILGYSKKKHSKDTTFTDFSLCYYNKDRFSPLYYYEGNKEGKGIVPGNEELDNIMVECRSRYEG